VSPEVGLIGRLATSVADGAAVDWNDVESDVAPVERRLVRHLRLVESIAALYRSIPDPDETVGDGAPQPGPRWGRLVMGEPIGHGTSCQVVRAFDTDLHRNVALKLLHADALVHRDAHDRILQEARRLARVRHPHVVQVLGAEKHNDRVGLWMELIEGESLDHIVRSRGPFGAREAAGIGQDLCAAVAAVHGAQLLHRDIKAQNVMREAGGRLVLMDFGTGEELRQDGPRGRLAGTPLYLAPEILGGAPASIRSDLYSVGVLLFYLVTGEFPLTAGSIDQLASAHAARQGRRLRDVRPDLPSWYVTVIDRALEHDPAARFQTAGEMEAALRDGPSARSQAPPSTLPAAVRSWRPAVLLPIATMLAVIVGVLAYFALAVPPAAGPPVARVAVLPFKAAPGAGDGFLAAALTDRLVATLGGMTSLRVTAPAAADKYQQLSAGQIGALLGVDAVVEGTVDPVPTAAGQPARARITTVIRRAGTGASLWSGSFEWMAGGGERLQSWITRAVGDAVNVAVAASGTQPASQGNAAAEEAFMRGRVAFAGYGAEAARRAIAAFQRSIAADSRYAPAYAGLSRAYIRLGQAGEMPMAEARQAAVIAMRQAQALDPNLADAHLAAADLNFYYDWDWAAAEGEYRRSLALNPSLSRALLNYAQLLMARGDADAAFAQADLARAVDPSSEVSVSYAVLQLYADKFAEAEALMRETVASEPGLSSAHLVLGRALEGLRRYDEAYAEMARAAELSGGGTVALQVALAALQARAGHPLEAQQAFAALERKAASHAISLTDRDRAYLQLALGDTEGACEAFERALEQRDWSLLFLGVDPRVDPLRDSPRFKRILEKIGL
jgi:tRNA A-37 threonylcarbamoyl transferase component Bud32/tetratricopeptide (TPR) repeat protein/TolB-like protein